MTSKLTFQIQNPSGWPAWLKNHIQQSGVKTIKLLDPDVIGGDPLPGVRTIGRLYFNTSSDLPLIRRGAAGAREYVNWCLPRIDKAPWVYAWEGPNEPEVSDLESCRWLNEFEYERVQLLHARGRRTASYSLGTSHPAGPQNDPLPMIRAKWRALQPAAAITDYLSLHEYGMRTLDPTALNEWHVGHYKRGVEVLRSMGRVPPVLITEFGIDYSGSQTEDGWRVALLGDEQTYMRQLAARDAEYSADPLVHGVYIFVWHDHNWPSFTMIESMSWRMTQYVRAQGAFAPAVTPAPGGGGGGGTGIDAGLLAEAEAQVIPMVPGHALWDYITGRGWALASREWTSSDGMTYQWGFDALRKYRILCRWSALGGVEECYARPN